MPPCAASISPCLVACAPVKAPRSWPNSSDSISVAGIAAQFTSTKGRFAREDIRWIMRATSPLPVPVSP